jgi:hypothetical protein
MPLGDSQASHKLGFTSETQFNTERGYGGDVEEALHNKGRYAQVVFNLIPMAQTHHIQRVSKLETQSAYPCALEGNLEWAVDAGSRGGGVYWLPLGYLSGTENGHFFVGSSIFIAGRDGNCEEVGFRKTKFGLVMYNKNL